MKKMKKENVKYWELEEGETVEFGNSFMRCYEQAGKLQLGTCYTQKDGEKSYAVKFVLDRDDLFGSNEGAAYLMQTLDDWMEVCDGVDYGD